ncbi:MAG TPA: succinylglutamate desuccinylase, partial [Opitutaceae bacterium]|nr:succinylglutamate desuccinylase [Opitutaceae bacterium]
IDGRPAKGGIIRPPGDRRLLEQWPESVYLHAHHTAVSYGFETASGFSLEERIAVHCLAVETAVAKFVTPG